MYSQNFFRTDANHYPLRVFPPSRLGNSSELDCTRLGVGSRVYEKARKRCRQIYLYMAEYILGSLRSRWGQKFEELNSKRFSEHSTRRDPGIFALLSDGFTREQLKLLIGQQNLTTPARMFIYMWTQSGDIVAIDKDHFRKTPKSKNRI